MFRAFRTPRLPECSSEEAVRLALSGRLYGVEVAVDPERLPEPKLVDTCFYESGIVIAAVDPGLRIQDQDSLALAFRVVEFAVSIRSGAVIVTCEDASLLKTLCHRGVERNVQIWVTRLPEEKIPNLYGIWDLSETEDMPQTERIAHVRISNTQMDPALLHQRLKKLRQWGYQGFIAITEELDTLSRLQLCVNRIDAADEKAALADVPLPPLYPPQGHPRVMFQARDIPEIRKRMHAPENADALRRYREALLPEAEIFLSDETKREMEQMTPEQLMQCKNRDRGMGAADAKYQHIRADILDRIEIRAFAYAIEGDATIGRSAVEAILMYLENCVALVYDDLGQLIYTAAEVYDWCYPLFTPQQRELLADRVLEFADRLEIGWPPLRQSALNGHGVESQVFRDLFAFGIALRDERPEIYDVTAGLLMWQFIPARRFFNIAHMSLQGGQYTIYRGPWEFLCAGLLRGMGMPNLFGPSQGHLFDWLLWARRPDGYYLHDGDNSTHNLPPVDHFERADAPDIPYYTDELDWLTYGRRPMEGMGNEPSAMLYDTTAKRCYLLASAMHCNPYYKE